MMPNPALRASLKVLAGAALLALLCPAEPVSAHKIEQRFSTGLRPTVHVRNKSGNILIKSWNRPEVLVVANHVSEKTEVDATQTGNRIDVITHLVTPNVKPEELRADYEITVPSEADLQIKSDAGNIRVENVAGELTFDTVAADVELREVANLLIVRTITGSLVCVRCAGRIEVSSVGGNFRFAQPVSNSLRADTASGKIIFDGDFQPGGTYVLKSYTGDIEVLFSEADSFEMNASSERGKVESDAAFSPPRHERRPPMRSRFQSSLFGTFGNYTQGQAKVQLSSFSGTIKVRKRGADSR
jgi:DUF4097 and DUF4098 domain-containing protein YvlB